MGINIAVIGNGGKEDALCWKLSQDYNIDNIYFLPGNGGAYFKNKVYQVHLNPFNFNDVKSFLEQKNIKLTIVDNESLIFKGLVDFLKANGFLVIGTEKQPSFLESCKAYSKDFMKKYQIRTPEYRIFNNYDSAFNYISQLNTKYVIKVSGPANGKGSFIIDSRHNGIKTLQQIMIDKEFGSSGDQIIVEDFIKGEEVSLIIVTDSESYQILPLTRDYKKAFDYDLGLNTEGMGGISPYNIFSESELNYIKKEIIEKTLESLKKENIYYKGFLYFGLIKSQNNIYVLEYNTRLGDPETEIFIPLIENSLLEIFDKLINNKIYNLKLNIKPQKSVGVVIASKGYPLSCEKDILITGVENIPDNDLFLFHNSTKFINNKLLTNGGRVLTLVALSDSIKQSKNLVYEHIDTIYFDGLFFRKDIGDKIWKYMKA